MWPNKDLETPEGIKRIRVRIGPQGRIVIPAPLREQLGLNAGEELIARVEDGRLVLERREEVVRRLRTSFANVAPGRVLSEELIAERREEANLEAHREVGNLKAGNLKEEDLEQVRRQTRRGKPLTSPGLDSDDCSDEGPEEGREVGRPG